MEEKKRTIVVRGNAALYAGQAIADQVVSDCKKNKTCPYLSMGKGPIARVIAAAEKHLGQMLEQSRNYWEFGQPNQSNVICVIALPDLGTEELCRKFEPIISRYEQVYLAMRQFSNENCISMKRKVRGWVKKAIEFRVGDALTPARESCPHCLSLQKFKGIASHVLNDSVCNKNPKKIREEVTKLLTEHLIEGPKTISISQWLATTKDRVCLVVEQRLLRDVISQLCEMHFKLLHRPKPTDRLTPGDLLQLAKNLKHLPIAHEGKKTLWNFMSSQASKMLDEIKNPIGFIWSIIHQNTNIRHKLVALPQLMSDELTKSLKTLIDPNLMLDCVDRSNQVSNEDKRVAMALRYIELEAYLKGCPGNLSFQQKTTVDNECKDIARLLEKAASPITIIASLDQCIREKGIVARLYSSDEFLVQRVQMSAVKAIQSSPRPGIERVDN